MAPVLQILYMGLTESSSIILSSILDHMQNRWFHTVKTESEQLAETFKVFLPEIQKLTSHCASFREGGVQLRAMSFPYLNISESYKADMQAKTDSVYPTP